MTQSIAVLGASGLVGATLTEMLLAAGRDVRPVIHSPGNAWRLTRRGMPLYRADILAEGDVAKVLEGCDVVVNCTRGGPKQMIDGLRNILKASRSAGVRRFIHLSSVAVYGEPPPPESVDEDAPTNPQEGTYGWLKLEQDRMVEAAATAGLPSVILCPPNILGPQSYFLLQILDSLTKGSFALVDGGGAPCVTVDVRNLCGAILAAAAADVSDGRRFFVTDAEDVTWAQLIGLLAPLAPGAAEILHVSAAEARAAAAPSVPAKSSLARAVKHLASSDVRAALRKDPLLARWDKALRDSVRKRGSEREEKLRLSVEGAVRVARVDSGLPDFDRGFATQQLRGVSHSCDRAMRELGYAPEVSFSESMDAFGRWLRQVRGMEEPSWDLARQLYA